MMAPRVHKFSFGISRSSLVKFNIIVAGEPCCGKSTFRKIFAKPYVNECAPAADHLILRDVVDCSIRFVEQTPTQANSLRKLLIEKHGEYINCANSFIVTKDALDERIHCLMYMFGPHRVLQTDRDCLQSVCGLVSIVPVLAKADTLTVTERETFLQEIEDLMAELDSGGDVPVHYQFIGHHDATDLDKSSSEQNSGSFDHVLGGQDQQERERGHNSSTKACEAPYAVESRESTPTSSYEHLFCCSPDATVSLLSGELHTEDSAEQQHLDAPLHTSTLNVLDQGKTSFPPTEPTLPNMSTHPLTSEATVGSVNGRLNSSLGSSRRANIFALVCSGSESGLREYPWGCSVSAYDERVSDLRRLQRLVFERGNIARLRDLTQHMTIALHQKSQRDQETVNIISFWVFHFGFTRA